MRSETRDPNKKKLLGIAVLAAILLTFSWFIGVPEQKNNNLAIKKHDLGVIVGFKIIPDYPQGEPTKTFVEPKVLSHAPEGYLAPKSMEGVEELLRLVKGFGDLINVPKSRLTEEFARRDKEILEKTKEVYGNPSHFQLGEQCGGEGAAWTFPPGSTTKTACGGDPEYSYPNAYYSGGGGACNTDPPCFGTGFCFEECYDYGIEGGGYCYCWVPSCLGVCGFQSYIWDSTNGTCGCGALGSEPTVDPTANNAGPVPDSGGDSGE